MRFLLFLSGIILLLAGCGSPSPAATPTAAVPLAFEDAGNVLPSPTTDGTRVAWRRWTYAPGASPWLNSPTGSEIIVLEPASGHQLTVAYPGASAPAIDGELLAWTLPVTATYYPSHGGGVYPRSTIYVHNLADGTTSAVAVTDTGENAPILAEGQVAWIDTSRDVISGSGPVTTTIMARNLHTMGATSSGPIPVTLPTLPCGATISWATICPQPGTFRSRWM